MPDAVRSSLTYRKCGDVNLLELCTLIEDSPGDMDSPYLRMLLNQFFECNLLPSCNLFSTNLGPGFAIAPWLSVWKERKSNASTFIACYVLAAITSSGHLSGWRWLVEDHQEYLLAQKIEEENLWPEFIMICGVQCQKLSFWECSEIVWKVNACCLSSVLSWVKLCRLLQ